MKTLRYLHYRLQWHLARFTGRLVHVDIEINNNCNQACLTCWHSEPDTRPFKIKSITAENAAYHLARFKELGALSVKFNLRGEPLLHKDLMSIIAYARNLGYVDIMINTNGVLLNFENVNGLNYAGLTSCIISIDSWNRETYAKLHGCKPAEHDLLMSHLSYMRFLHRLGHLNFKVKLNYHVNQYNYNESMDFYYEHFTMFELVKRDSKDRGGQHISIDRHKKKNKRKRNCPHAMRRVTVTTDGHIYPCCVCYTDPADIRLRNIPYLQLDRIAFNKQYRDGNYTKTCRYCTSGDIWK